MKKTISISLGLLFLLAPLCGTVWSQATAPGQAEAVNEAIYRQANLIKLQRTLGEAKAAEGRADLVTAGQDYDKAWELVQKIGLPRTAPETQQTVSGLAAA